MNRTIFSQLLDFVPKREFRRCVERHSGNYRVKNFSCWDQFLCMSFAQLTRRDSLRDIEVCLRGMPGKLYRVGLRTKVSRATLADANENRSSKVYADFCKVLMLHARKLYANDRFSEMLDEIVYVLDSSYISLCLSMFSWAQMGGHNKAIFKIHTLLDLKGSIPSFVAISSGKFPDNKMIDQIFIEPGAFYVMDKAYVDFARLNNIHQAKGYFVVRSKKNINFQRHYSLTVDQSTGARSDQVGMLAGSVGSKKFSDQIRRIGFYDKENKKKLTFLTNNFHLPPEHIAHLYKKRWTVEIFFKWIKQNLRIKKFFGTSQNAVETQIWIAICTYLLVAIAKKELRINVSLQKTLQLFSVALFEEIPILSALNHSYFSALDTSLSNQLDLFDP